jgi:hypothetical protein
MLAVQAWDDGPIKGGDAPGKDASRGLQLRVFRLGHLPKLEDHDLRVLDEYRAHPWRIGGCRSAGNL